MHFPTFAVWGFRYTGKGQYLIGNLPNHCSVIPETRCTWPNPLNSIRILVGTRSATWADSLSNPVLPFTKYGVAQSLNILVSRIHILKSILAPYNVFTKSLNTEGAHVHRIAGLPRNSMTKFKEEAPIYFSNIFISFLGPAYYTPLGCSLRFKIGSFGSFVGPLTLLHPKMKLLPCREPRELETIVFLHFTRFYDYEIRVQSTSYFPH